MTTNRINSKTAAFALAFALAATAVVAPGCSSDDNSKPDKTPIFGAGGSGDEDGGGAGGKSNGGKANGGKANGGGTAAGGSNGTVDGGDASAAGGAEGTPDSGAGGADAGTCDLPPGDHDCYPCDPVTNDQFLNHCGGTCYPFPNKDRLKDPNDPNRDLWKDGKLIDLP